jgi:putative ATPase
MSDLWAPSREKVRRAVEPLAVRMRPRTLEEFIGQSQILGEGKLLRRIIEADAITSLILHGPAGTGKTTLAEVIAHTTKRRFVRENAASVGVKRVREVIDEAAGALEASGVRTILFLDEIHRFSKSQQDVLLGDVERGLITLIGATTENPLFAVNSALISRSTLFRLEPLGPGEVVRVLRAALADRERGYGAMDLSVTDEALSCWALKCEGDARRALTALEVAVLSSRKRSEVAQGPVVIDGATAEESIQEKVAVYGDDGHYDAASAMIKSVRGSDPDAALYWIARMLEAGEDPRFIARRLAILASEDIGNADPRAVVIAEACWTLCERIGMPECRITLGQAATYLALAPKSNAVYVAIDAAIADVRDGRVLPVPMHLRDPNSSPIADATGRGVMMRSRGGETYQYSHDADGKVTGQDYLGVSKRYYEPTEEGAEKILKQRLQEIRKLRERRRRDEQQQSDEG